MTEAQENVFEMHVASLKQFSSSDAEKMGKGIYELSKIHDGRIMVHFSPEAESAHSHQPFWFNPRAMQGEMDNPRSTGNNAAKLRQIIESGGYLIDEIEPLVVDKNDPLGFLNAQEAFAEKRGYESRTGLSGWYLPQKPSTNK